MNADVLLILVVLSNLRLLGSSRLGACIRTTAAQGILLGLLPLWLHADNFTWRIGLMAAGSIVLKGAVFPWLLFRAIREAEVQREIEPFVGYNLSLLVGVAAFGVSFWLSQRLPLSDAASSSPCLRSVGALLDNGGLFLIVSRRKAVNQVLGFL